MASKIGIYEFFAYTVPGALYIITILYILNLFNIIVIDTKLYSLTLIQFLFFVSFSYIIGHIFDQVCNTIWYRFFKINHEESTLKYFKDNFPKFEIKFNANDWPLLLAYLRKENMDIVYDIEKFNASAILLKNISFAFIILSIAHILHLIFIKFTPVNFILILFFFISSIISMNKSLIFNKWFSAITYESIIARNLSISDFIENKMHDEL